MKKFFIYGVAGAFGQAFARLLKKSGFEVRGADLAARDAYQGESVDYYQSDVRSPSPDLMDAINACDCVLTCLPEAETLQSIQSVVPRLRPAHLFATVVSIQLPLVDVMEGSRNDIEFISLNPMFAPGLDFLNQNIAIVPVRAQRSAELFYDLLKAWGAQLCFMTGQQHDQQTSMIQIATHAAILSFGLTLQRLGYTLDRALPMSTPPHRTLLALVFRIISSNPVVYWSIQEEHHLGVSVRNELKNSIADLNDMIEGKNFEAFEKMFEDVKGCFGGHMEGMKDFCSQILKTRLELGKR